MQTRPTGYCETRGLAPLPTKTSSSISHKTARKNPCQGILSGSTEKTERKGRGKKRGGRTNVATLPPTIHPHPPHNILPL